MEIMVFTVNGKYQNIKVNPIGNLTLLTRYLFLTTDGKV